MDLKKKNSLFERDFVVAKDYFPLLNYSWSKDHKMWIISGKLDICDVKGDYWNTFDIAIIVSESYPYCVPQVIEKSKLIPRDDDWHISKDGICCLDMDNALIAMSRLGINIKDFITNKIYPYFANQLYKLEEKQYAGEEYKHYTAGLIQYYLEELKVPTENNIVVFLSMILSKADLTRNKLCPCSSGKKIKNCHGKAIEVIKSFGRDKIVNDYKKICESLK